MLMRSEVTVLDLLRHGEPQGGLLVRGSGDDPLTPLGWEQMREAVGEFGQWNHIHTSPLLRCSDFAHDLQRNIEIPLTVQDDLREIHFGDWEGRSFADVVQNEPGALVRYWDEDDAFTPPGAEDVRLFIERVDRCLRRIVSDHSGQHLLLVSHGGTMRAILSVLLGMSFRSTSNIDVPYGCLTRIEVYAEDGAICGCQLKAHAICLPVPYLEKSDPKSLPLLSRQQY